MKKSKGKMIDAVITAAKFAGLGFGGFVVTRFVQSKLSSYIADPDMRSAAQAGVGIGLGAVGVYMGGKGGKKSKAGMKALLMPAGIGAGVAGVKAALEISALRPVASQLAQLGLAGEMDDAYTVTVENADQALALARGLKKMEQPSIAMMGNSNPLGGNSNPLGGNKNPLGGLREISMSTGIGI